MRTPGRSGSSSSPTPGWIEEFHFDGQRLDGTQQIFDKWPLHMLADVVARVRAGARGRGTIVVGENAPQHVRLLRPIADGGCGVDTLWNDDHHHAVMVAITGVDEAYWSGYRGTAQELVSCAKWGFHYQGQWYGWQRKRRGTPALDLAPDWLVSFVQNHDQIANSVHGLRLHALRSPGRHRADAPRAGPADPVHGRGDATEPYTLRGCIAQAWSVAEVLRCWVKTASPPERGEASVSAAGGAPLAAIGGAGDDRDDP